MRNPRPTATPRRNEHRAGQLRAAKRAQRARERERGLVPAQFNLPVALAARLAVARRNPDFEQSLAAFLDEQVVDAARYPQLALLCWNRRDALLPAREAFELYEGNRRFVDPSRMDEGERTLFDALVSRYGAGTARG
jgi:hypothetical protein